MPGPFAITAATNTIRLDDKRQAQTSFTVFNNSGRQIRGRAILVPQNPAAQSWVTLSGEPEQDFAISGTQQYPVRIAVPPDAPAGSYPFRLDVVGVENPDEQLSEGPTVQFEVPQPVRKTGFPIWIPVAAVVALLAVGAIAFFFIQARQAEEAARSATATTVAAIATADDATRVAAAVTATADEVARLAASAAATQTAEARPQTRSHPLTLTLKRATYYLRLVEPGTIRVAIRESAASDLEVSIVGPAGVVDTQLVPPGRDMAYEVTQTQFDGGGIWRVDIRDVTPGFELPRGRAQITYPSGSRNTTLDVLFLSGDAHSESTDVVVLKKAGRIEARAQWTAPPEELNMTISTAQVSPNEQPDPRRGPQQITIPVTQQDLVITDTWRIRLYNRFGIETTNGQMDITHP